LLFKINHEIIIVKKEYSEYTLSFQNAILCFCSQMKEHHLKLLSSKFQLHCLRVKCRWISLSIFNT